MSAQGRQVGPRLPHIQPHAIADKRKINRLAIDAKPQPQRLDRPRLHRPANHPTRRDRLDEPYDTSGVAHDTSTFCHTPGAAGMA